MIKAVGAVLIVVSFAMSGAVRASELKTRARTLAALVSALELMRGEVVDRLAPIPEIAERLAVSGPVKAREFFSLLSSELASLGQREFSEIWSSSAKVLGLSHDELEALRDLGRSLGRYGAAEQDVAISRCMNILGAFAIQAREDADSGRKLYGGLGITAGLLLAITLI